MASKLHIKPLFDNVLVKPLEAQQKSAGGLYLPQSAQEKPQEVEVVAVGDGIRDDNGKLIPMVVKVGQKVLVKKWGGDDVKVNREEWKLIKQSDILAIIE